MSIQSFPLRGEHITLAHVVKAVGLAESGGQAKIMVREGMVTVQGVVETRPGRKLTVGDQFGMGEQQWVLERVATEGE